MELVFNGFVGLLVHVLISEKSKIINELYSHCFSFQMFDLVFKGLS